MSTPTGAEEKDGEAAVREQVEKVRASIEKNGLKLAQPTADELGGLQGVKRDYMEAFSGLCKLCAQDTGAQGEKTRTILELVLAMLQKCPSGLKAHEPFVAVLRSGLCPPLAGLSMSTILKISDISLQIFTILTKGFKEQLKAEIGIFIDEIVLRILESLNSTYHHKYRALQVFYKFCADPTCALDLFLNFDCNVDEKNVFERMVDYLSRIAQGKYADQDYATMVQPAQELELRMLALRGLVMLMGSLQDWLRRASRSGDSSVGVGSRGVGGEDGAAVESQQPAAASRSLSDGKSVIEQKSRKKELQNCVDKFNLKPKKGIEHLRQGKFIDDTAESMAELFKNEDLGLDKTAVGDFLGEDKPFNQSVLDALIHSSSFKGLELDVALRAFLSLFRLPGEAQKISRIMEKFAEKYCQDHPGKFANNDSAFVLSFALIMLQTDLHNPGVKNKMTKDQFVRQNRGVDNGADFPMEFLHSLYDSVLENPMSLKEDDDAKAKQESQSAQSLEARAKLFQKESKAIVSRSKEMMAQRATRHKGATFVHASSPEHARPLFEVACWPMLATLSVLVETHDEKETISQCVDGFKHCIRVSVFFDMHTQRDASITTLSKFTYLTAIKEIRQKNIDCLKALLAIGTSEGNGLGPAWQHILLCVSQLERLQLISEKSRQDHQYFESDEGARNGTGRADAIKRRTIANGAVSLLTMTPEDQQIELVNSEALASQIDQSQITLLFDNSARLGEAAIEHFVTQLSRVSKEELQIFEQPRIFALQKLVEVAMSNMSRPPQVWQRIWKVLSAHFIHVATHPNIRVGMYSIDSMRQLAKCFLENDQLCAANLQGPAEMLRPFEAVMMKDKVSREVRELIVSSMSTLAFTRERNVRSGWKTVLSILHASVQEPGNEAAPEGAWSIMERVLEDSYEVFVENFSHGIRALAAFASQSNLDIALKATLHLQKAAACLVAEKTPSNRRPPPQREGDADNSSVSHWFQILRALHNLVSDKRPGVREAGLKAIVHCLRDHGMVAFDEEMWRMVFKGVIKPLFEDVHQQLKEGDATLVEVVSEIVLRGVKDLSPKRLSRCMPEIFPLLCKLITVPSPEVRLVVQDILLEQVQPMLSQAAPVVSETNGR